MADNKELVDIVGQPIGGEMFDAVEQPKEEQPVMSTLVAEDVLADAILEENLSATEEIVIEGFQEEIPETNVEIEIQENAAKEEKTDSYTICPGDTLIAISTKLYGDDSAVAEICALNHISDTDNIQIGQKILLPY
jgi:nucleoid-associated protein YgaU